MPHRTAGCKPELRRRWGALAVRLNQPLWRGRGHGICSLGAFEFLWCLLSSGSIAVGQIPSLGHEAAGTSLAAGRAGPGLGMKEKEQSLSPSAHPQHPVGAGTPVVGELDQVLEDSGFWRVPGAEAPGTGRNWEELGRTGRTPRPRGCSGSLWVSLGRCRSAGGFQCPTRSSSREDWGLVIVVIPGLFTCSLVLIQY